MRLLNTFSQFPAETNEGSVEWKDNVIVIHSNYEHHRIRVNSLRYISIVAYILEDTPQISLCLVDHESDDYFKKKYIPCHYAGFSHAWQRLSTDYTINLRHLKAVLSRFHSGKDIDPPFEKILWRKNTQSNFQILRSYPDDLHTGFEIFGPAPAMIRWNADDNTLLKFKDVLSFDENSVVTQFPVRVGNVEIKDSVDITQWNVKLFMPGKGSDVYFTLKAALLELTKAKRFTVHEHPEENSYSLYIRSGILTFRLHYPFGSPYVQANDYFFDPDLVILSIEIDLPKTYDHDYADNIIVDDAIIFSDDVKLNLNESHPEVQPRPALIQQKYEDKPIIWVDRKGGYIGFSDASNCYVIPMKKFRHFEIQNMLRGPAESTRLCINNEVIMTSRQVIIEPFKSAAEELARITGKEVIISPDLDSGY